MRAILGAAHAAIPALLILSSGGRVMNHGDGTAMALWESVLEAVPGLAWAMDGAGWIVRWNAQASEVLGLTAEKAGRVRWDEVLDAPDAARLRDRWAEGVESLECDVRLRGAARARGGYLLRMRPLPGSAWRLCVALPRMPVAAERADKAMHEREELLSEQARLLNLTNDAIIVCDWDDRIVYWNRGAEDIYGYTAAEAMGHRKAELLRTRYQGTRAEILETLLREHRWEGELRHTRRDGKEIVVNTRWSLDRTADGRPTAVLKSDNDITERKRAEEALRASEERLRLITNNLPALVSYVDHELRYRFVNAAYAEWFGADGMGLAGRHISEVLPREIYEHRLPRIQEVLAGRTVRFEGPTPHRELGERQTEITCIPDVGPDGETRGFYVFVSDVTERMATQRALESQAAALMEADRRKDEFLAMLAHELRNPLAAIANAGQFLQSDEPATRGWAAEVVNRQANQLGRLVDDLLDVSRINSGKIRLRVTLMDAATALDRAVESSRALYAQRGQHFSARYNSEELWVRADATRLEQIVCNLLTNAAKYTDRGGRIALTAAREGEEVVIRVSDDGVGIAPEKIAQMWEIFAQGERNLSRSEGGLGLGLTIVKTLAALHGGRAEAQSAGEGCGSTFTIRLPLAFGPDRATAPAPPEPEPEPFLRPLRVLIVEDNVDAAEGLRRLLERSGHTVHVAFTAAEGRGLAPSVRPDVFLLDLGLPDLDGFRLARELRGMPEHAMALFVAVSGYGQDEDRRRAREVGFAHHFTKPLDLAGLREVLSRHRVAG